MSNEITKPSWNEYQDISKALSQLLSKGYTKPMIKTVLEQMKEAKTTSEMTAKEAVKILKDERDNDVFVLTDYREKLHEALTMAIKALEQQPCIEDYPTCTECEHYDSEKHYCPRFCQVIKDTLAEAQPCENCISREHAKQFLYYEIERLHDDGLYDCFSRIIDDMYNELPSVTPKYTDEEIDKAQAVEQAYVDKMVELAVEETKRPKGKWIEIEIDAGEFIYKCTKCGMRVINPYKYCPMCGSYNGGGEDAERL